MEFEVNERIRQIMEEKNLSPSEFAEALSVSRPLVSHILSHRNKAGVDLLQKVLQRFSEIDAHWLLTGKKSEFTVEQVGQNNQLEVSKEPLNLQKEEKKISKTSTGKDKKRINRIILLFDDGSFEVSEPEASIL